jgi:GTP-binding protein
MANESIKSQHATLQAQSMRITSALFDGSAPDFASCPQETLPEFALIGRSNVGKSTLLNRLADRKDLARVSAKPGFTKMLNFYTINRRWRLVDLPGYGYAKTSHSERVRYTRLIEDYLLKRSSLACAFVLVDSSIPPQAVDFDFVRWMRETRRPFSIVFTKEDKARGDTAVTNIERFMRTISPWFQAPPLTFVISARNQIGLRQLQQTIAEAADGEASHDSDTP